MRAIILFLIVTFYAGCTNQDKTDKKQETKKPVKVNNKKNLSDIVQKNFLSLPSSYVINIECDGEFIPIRNRILSKEELATSQLGNADATALNGESIIEQLHNGDWVKLLKEDTLGYHYVEVIDRINQEHMADQEKVYGFIVAKYCGKPTLRKIEIPQMSRFKTDSITIAFLDYHKRDGNLLEHAYAYISQEADLIQVLSFYFYEKNSIYYKFYVIINQSNSLLIDGTAEFYKFYTDKNGKKNTVYKGGHVLGHNFEIHIADDDNSAFLELTDPIDESIFPKPEEDIMYRIK